MRALTVTAKPVKRAKVPRSLALKKDSFWNKMSRAEQEDYLQKHPDSKYKDAPLKKASTDKKVPDEAKQDKTSTEPKPEHKRPKAKLSDLIKDWHEEQKRFFEEGQHQPDSVTRNKAADIIVRKHKGLHKSIKNEVKEWKVATHALRKLKKGEGLDQHDKEALKSVALHAGLVVGDFALAGGAKTLLSGAAALMGGFLSHSLMVNYGKAAIYASKKHPADDETDDELLDELIRHMSEGMRNAPLPVEKWVNAFQKKGAKNEKPKK